MQTVKIVSTNNPAILKFELADFITKESLEFKNIDEAKPSALAQKLFYLPFVKTVYISANFIAIERYNIVEWPDVQEDVVELIQDFLATGAPIVSVEDQPKKQAFTVYAESTPNPNVMKFVANKMLVKSAVEFKNIEEAAPSNLAKELFAFPFVKEIFMDENYISITKYNVTTWEEVVQEMRAFIKNYLELGKEVIDESSVLVQTKDEKALDAHFDSLDETSQRIINILEEYVKPAVQSDGGNIAFESYDADQKRVKVVLQGACSGCPSSTFTLKSGIENMLKDMLSDSDIVVEAINQ